MEGLELRLFLAPQYLTAICHNASWVWGEFIVKVKIMPDNLINSLASNDAKLGKTRSTDIIATEISFVSI